MKQELDLEKAAESELVGALATRAGSRHNSPSGSRRPFTAAQRRALSDLVHSLLRVAREAGAVHKRIRIGDVSLELREHGAQEVLSVRTGGS
jgi:hypothetical protein